MTTGRDERTGGDVPPGLRLSVPGPADEGAFLDAVARSRELHRPWVSPPATAEEYRAFLDSIGSRVLRYLIRDDDDALVGVVTASEIVRGGFLSCYLGYYGFSPAVGGGRMTAGLRMVVDHLFGVEGLHRVEANIQPANVRSIALVRRVGFHKEGFSPDYLFIDGAWRDHERWALRAGSPPPAQV